MSHDGRPSYGGSRTRSGNAVVFGRVRPRCETAGSPRSVLHLGTLRGPHRSIFVTKRRDAFEKPRREGKAPFPGDRTHRRFLAAIRDAAGLDASCCCASRTAGSAEEGCVATMRMPRVPPHLPAYSSALEAEEAVASNEGSTADHVLAKSGRYLLRAGSQSRRRRRRSTFVIPRSCGRGGEGSKRGIRRSAEKMFPFCLASLLLLRRSSDGGTGDTQRRKTAAAPPPPARPPARPSFFADPQRSRFGGGGGVVPGWTEEPPIGSFYLLECKAREGDRLET